MNNKPWKAEADIYKKLLITEINDIHFGVGIPGNKELGVIPCGNGNLSALDIGCGSGENVVALSSLGYQTVGIDSSERQILMAEKLCYSLGLRDKTKFYALSAEDVGKVDGKFDVIISMGVLHFCSDLSSVIHDVAHKIKTNGKFVLTLPHPMDMIADYKELESDVEIQISSYYPSGQLIRGARYWAKFGGAVPSGYEFNEYVYTVSDVVNMLIREGFTIEAFLEPMCDHKENYPCRFSSPAEKFVDYYSRRMPQYAIYVASKQF